MRPGTMQIRNKIHCALFVLLLLFGCAKKEPPRPSPIMQLREMGQLATAEYELAKVVRARDEATWYKLGERRILITCRARIKGGIDLSQIRDVDIQTTGNTISIKLPPPQIISFNLPPQNIQVAYTNVGPLRDPFTQAETNSIMQQAERQIRRQADSLNILQKAGANAVTFITRFFEGAGYEQVAVSFRYAEGS